MNKTTAVVGIGIGIIAVYLGVTGYYQSAWRGIRGECGATGDKGKTVGATGQSEPQTAGEATMDVPGDYYYITTGGALFKTSDGLY